MGRRTTPFTYNTEFILQAIDLGVYGVDAQGCIEFCNDEFTRILGYSKKELVGQHAHRLFHDRTAAGEVLAEAECALCRLRDDEGVQRVHYERFWTKHGVPVIVDCTSLRVTKDGLVSGLLVSCRPLDTFVRADTILFFQNQLLERIAKGENLRAIMEKLSEYVDQLFPGAKSSILLYDAVKQGLQEYVGNNLPKDFYTAIAEHAAVYEREGGYQAGESLWRSVFTSSVPSSIQDPAFYCTYPLATRDHKILGIFVLVFGQNREPAPSDLRLLEMLVHLAGLAVEREYRQQKIQELACFDSITGLANRVLYWETATRELTEAIEKQNTQFAILFFDVDRFRTVNEGLGHEAGDLLLKTIAERLKQSIGEERFAARIGGDEFVVILKDTLLEQDVLEFAQRIHELLAQPFVLAQGQVIHLTVSMGVAMYPQHGKDVYVLTKNAETAMYVAKDSGRNTVRFYAQVMESNIQERMWIEEELDYALKEQQFRVFYQPKMHIATGHITSAEALLRWFHPVRGLISPGEFIPIAEQTGQIVAIGEWVVKKVCEHLTRSTELGLPLLPIAVNVSPKQFQHPQFIYKLRQIFEETGVDPSFVEVEITETTLMDNTEETLNKLLLLKQIGVRIAIDDFGMGYSSLGYLKRFPVNALKIDQSFIREVHDESTAAIVTVMIALGHQLQMHVIAEGVETEAQLDFLRQHGCDEIQGYLLSKPMPLNEFRDFVRKNYGL
ncbi:sensor domain-containing protein [Sulfoacidibacillus thermotolerans]|uniref:Diguanylate cyclase n=1 Tax=Sulfoacidibacillus thermotolerans TaxID=1765684 RepID=A0A2U3D958_SULT2|nr:EAL domain-containing protein [Sulfoacidibacillus thermotolerans]PWI57795.1 hypothetical protein BM613_06265 [Sulfoacidibacillus thermotolerans]